MNIRKKTRAELLADLKSEQAHYNEIKVAIAELTAGAVSASISTAGGSQSYTRASLEDLRALLRVSAARLDRLLSKVNSRAAVSGKPHRIWVSFD